MAELQKTNAALASEMAQRFVQFVIMQSQQILFMLGGPSPDGESIPPNLEAARILIDQLEMVQIKTQGNLSAQESSLLEDALSRVRFAFVQVSGGDPVASAHNPTAGRDPVPAAPESAPTPAPSKPSKDEPDDKKKFTKSYG